MTYVATNLRQAFAGIQANQYPAGLIVRRPSSDAAYELPEHATSADDLRTSLHEAAHAVVGMMLGMRPSKLELHDGGGGTCEFESCDCSPFDDMTMSLSGQVAACLGAGREFEWGRYYGALKDEMHCEVYFGRKGIGPDDARKAQKRAELICVLAWPAITELAARLRKYRVIDNRMIESVLAQLKLRTSKA